jgi:hypothetical protein
MTTAKPLDHHHRIIAWVPVPGATVGESGEIYGKAETTYSKAKQRF